MNERIEELAEQAEEWNVDGDKCEVNLAKFAELIVRECIIVAIASELKSESDVSAINDLIHKIKEHFGVKE
jgi:hypothetical protein